MKTNHKQPIQQSSFYFSPHVKPIEPGSMSQPGYPNEKATAGMIEFTALLTPRQKLMLGNGVKRPIWYFET